MNYGLVSSNPIIPFLPGTMEFPGNEVNYYLLNDAAAFLKEGIELRNCLYENPFFIENTQKGHALYFSVRSTVNTNLRGTLELYLNGYNAIIHQFKSRKNEFNFLQPNEKKFPMSVAFLETTRNFFAGAAIRSFLNNIWLHFKNQEELL